MVGCLRRYIIFTCCIERLGLFCAIPHFESYLSTWSSFYYKTYRSVFSLFKYWRGSCYISNIQLIYSYSKLIRVYSYIIAKISNICTIFYSKLTSSSYIFCANIKGTSSSYFSIVTIDLSSSPIRQSIKCPISRTIGFVLQFVSKFITTTIICYSTCSNCSLCTDSKGTTTTYRFIWISCWIDSNYICCCKCIKFKYIRIAFSTATY